MRAAGVFIPDMAFTIRQLQYFVAVAEQGTVSRAAQNLSISQSSVNEAIKELETDLGVELFERHPRGLNITHKGHQFLRHATKILADVSDARRTFFGDQSATTGRLQLGVTSLVAGYVLSDLLARYRRAHPAVEISAIEDNGDYLEHLLVGGKLDVAVMVTSNLRDRMALQSEILEVSAYRLWLPLGHPLAAAEIISIGDIASEPLIMLSFDEIETNTGKLLAAIGAKPHGNWSGGHAVGWVMNAPEFGDLAVGDNFQKHSYPWGIMINANGERFVDEGADFRNYTYAKYGRVILMQPGQFAWQVFDKKIIPMLRDEYRIKQVTKVRADTLEDLVKRLDDVDAKRALETIKAYNKAVRTDVAFNPNVKDGRRTEGLAINKSNWANTIDEPPFEAYAVTCGITFTFGGLKIDTSGRVIDTDGQAITGLHAAGELVGGLFYFNYPGGTGLMAGSVFGRVAGTTAGQRAAQTPA